MERLSISVGGGRQRAAPRQRGERRGGRRGGNAGALLAMVLAFVGWGGVQEASALVNLQPRCLDNTKTAQLCSAGAFHTCAANGTLIVGSDRQFTRKVACWGWQEFGQSLAPKTVEAPTLIASGARHSCAADINGVVSCWGSNQYAQTEVATPLAIIGRPISPTSSPPIDIFSEGTTKGCTYCGKGDYISDVNSREFGSCEDNGLFDYSKEEAVCKHECILEGIEGVFQSFIFANKSTDAREYPTFRFDGRFVCGARKLSAGGQHTCVIYGDKACSNCNSGYMKCYGSNIYGQSSVPWCWNRTDVPERVADPERPELGRNQMRCKEDGKYPLLWLEVSAGLFHTCGCDSNGFLHCWGDSAHGQLDHPPGSGFKAVAAGAYHSCAVRSDSPSDGFAGEVVCWGNNSYGQAWSHTELLELDSSPITVGGKFLSVSCASTHSCGIFLPEGNTPNGATGAGGNEGAKVVCWGANFAGQTDVPVSASKFMISVTTGWEHSCAVGLDDHFIVCWGGKKSQNKIGLEANLMPPTCISTCSQCLTAGASMLAARAGFVAQVLVAITVVLVSRHY